MCDEKHHTIVPKAEARIPAKTSGATNQGQSEEKEKGTLSTQGQKCVAAGVMLILTAVMVVFWFKILDQIEGQVRIEHSVRWNAPANAAIKPGPPSFFYDRSINTIYYKGIIDGATKQELVSLLVVADTNSAADLNQTYSDAINRLAYEAYDDGEKILQGLLLLGAISATLGMMLRVMGNFVGVICYKRDLRLDLWWPYYAMSPALGFLIGLIAVLLVKSDLLLKGEAAMTNSLWWAGVALIAGFGASEFTERLRLITKALFGGVESKSGTDSKSGDKNHDP